MVEASVLRPPLLVLPLAAAPRRAPAAVVLGFACVALNLVISGNLLFLAGIPYDATGGNPLEKLHPGTYCAALALVIALARQGIGAALRAAPSACLFLALMLACMLFQLATGGADRLVIYPESFLPAGALAIVFALAAARTRRRLAWMLTALCLLNVAIALIEAQQGRQWIPVYLLDRELVVSDPEFRPTALYDHPLTGAQMTLIGLCLALALPLRPWGRGALLLAYGAGLLAFGGRAAIAVAAAMLAALAVVALLRRLAAGRLRLSELVLLLAGVVAAMALVALLLAGTDMGARVLARFTWDASAAARGVQWRILGMLDTGEWLAGASRERVALLVANLGLRFPFVAVENFWLLMFLNLGLLGFPLFVAGLLALLAGAWRRAGWQGRVLLVAVMTVASTSNSLGRKSNILTVLIPAVLAGTGFTEGRRRAG